MTRRGAIGIALLVSCLLIGPARAFGATDATGESAREGSVVSSAKDENSNDPRLAVKVTLSAKRKCVFEVLDQLSSLSGVPLIAGRNAQDWQVRDRKMTILVKDVPLVEIMRSVARAMKLRWRLEEDAPKSPYRLLANPDPVAIAQARQGKQAGAASSEMTRARDSLIRMMPYLAGLSPMELSALKRSNPYLWALASTGAAEGLDSFMSLCPEARAAFLTGTTWSASASSLSPAARRALAERLLPGMYAMQLARGLPQYRDTPEFLLERLDKIRIRINARKGLENFAISEIGIDFPNLTVNQSDGNLSECPYGIDTPFYPFDSKTAKMAGAAYVDKLEKPQEWEGNTVSKTQFSANIKDAWQEEKPTFTTIDPEDPVEHLVGNLDLKKKAELDSAKQNRYSIDDLEGILADRFGLNIVGDAYNRQLFASLPDSQNATLGQILDVISKGLGSNWWKRDSILEIRERTWYARRKELIPESWLTYWRDIFEKTGILDLENLALIASLTDEQYRANMADDGVLNNRQGSSSDLGKIMTPVGYVMRPILRFYASLTQSQKAALLSNKGLNLFTILGTHPDKRAVIEDIVGSPINTWSCLNPDSGVTDLYLFGQSGKKEGLPAYTFTLRSTRESGTRDEFEVEIITPKYVAPAPKSEPQGNKPAQPPVSQEH